MNQSEFEEELHYAQSRLVAMPEPFYWSGYKRGLQRGYLGGRFSSTTDHFAWLDLRNDRDPLLAELGRGYQEGLEAVVTGRLARREAPAASKESGEPNRGVIMLAGGAA